MAITRGAALLESSVTVQECDPLIRADLQAIDSSLQQLFEETTIQSAASPEASLKRAADGVEAAMRYAVFGDAKRIRPLLSLRIARLLQADTLPVLKAAAAVELLHCASLIVDDLPCMDNATERRGKATLFARFGESRTLLASFALVAMAADAVAAEAQKHEPHRDRLLAFERRLLQTMRCDSLIGGQAWDLSLPEEQRRDQRVQFALRKTAPLFELAVAAGTVSLEVDPERLRQLTEFARSLAVLFQGVDDRVDGGADQDGVLRRQLTLLRGQIRKYGPDGSELEELLQYLVGIWPVPLANTDVFC